MIENQRHLFDIPDNVHYLNCAYMSPLLNSAAQAGQQGVKAKASPWKISSTDFFTESDTARKLFSKLINANTKDIAIIPAVSYGTAVAAINLPLEKDEKVLVLAEEFPSNLYAWRAKAKIQDATIKTVERPENNDWTSAVLEALDNQVKIAVLPQTHWVDGGFLQLEKIAAALREKGCALVIDLTQSLGVIAADVEKIQPDFLICATYKWLLGPYSFGFLYANPKHHHGIPIEQGWVNRPSAKDFSRLIDYSDSLNPDATRFDVGERSNFHLLPIAIKALQQIHTWGQNDIEATLEIYTGKLCEMLEELGFSSCNKAFRSPHYLGVKHPKDLPKDLLPQLAKEQIYISQRGNILRLSPHLYNNKQDAEKLINTLAKLIP